MHQVHVHVQVKYDVTIIIIFIYLFFYLFLCLFNFYLPHKQKIILLRTAQFLICIHVNYAVF